MKIELLNNNGNIEYKIAASATFTINNYLTTGKIKCFY